MTSDPREAGTVLCRVDDCGRVATFKRRELCQGHYAQERAGETFTPIPRRGGRSFERDAGGRKRCCLCQAWKPEDAFASSSGKRDGLQSRCRACNAAIYRATAGKVRDKMREQRFDLTREQFDAMLESQGRSCAICGTTDPGNRYWCVDHDHTCCPASNKTCGQCVRGILCSYCNAGLGQFRDDPNLLNAAAAYVSAARHSRAAVTRGAR